MHPVPAAVLRSLPEAVRRARRIEAALSGGLDSVVLLHILAQLKDRLNAEISAVHVHHGLHPEADGWLGFCRSYCAALGVPLRWQKVIVEPAGKGIEAAARQARYRVFAQSPADIIAAAHHADDQTETFFLAALRGGGLRALAAMPELRPLAENPALQLWRPLLPYTRAELAAYAAEHRLEYVTDPANSDPSYLRNWLRHDGLPHWRRHSPQIDRHIRTAVALLQDELAVLQEAVEVDRQAVCDAHGFHTERWRQLTPARRRQSIRLLLLEHGGGLKNKAFLADFCRVLYEIGAGEAQWRLNGQILIASRNRLYFLPEGWQRQYTPAAGQGGLQEWQARGWQFRSFRRGLPPEMLGQTLRIRPIESRDLIATPAGRKPPKQILHEHGIPPFIRSCWPLLTDAENRPLALANLCADSRFAVSDGRIPCDPAFDRFVPPNPA
ncbi:tRNA(Ile)-lysidine synthase [Kingella potus]|uniref:tRNA(Ile)-lysidine synthase n=1 Tax=Kingella potus TaxID=265175 RepID=A0A377QYI9_9NEIS|nr:tRNA lysidine(34) synthetase TilS [Kingella potus]STR00087.1 tRNA(Ile)-lysidine synthase [Kingella potus]